MEVEPTPGSAAKIFHLDSHLLFLIVVILVVIGDVMSAQRLGDSLVVANEFSVVAVVAVVVSVVVVVAAGVVDEHGDDGQEDGDEEQDVVPKAPKAPKVRGGSGEDEELSHLHVEGLPKIGSRALHTKLAQLKVKP